MVQVRSRLWLPFTQMHSFDASSRTFVRASGVTIEDAAGRRLFDATSSIWTIVHGHSHRAIVDAITAQAARLDHVTALGAVNPAAEQLAARLCALSGMDYAFFSGDGASAVEAALKMAAAYWQRRGQAQRTRFVHLSGSYHGDTSGAMSVSDIAPFRASFGALTFETLSLDDAGELVRDDTVAAVIVEPLMQAARGLEPVAKERYAALADCAPLLIVDEIATGFGRTGTMFAVDQLNLQPDIMCLGKALSGGVLPLSATLVRAPVFDAFSGEPGAEFFHGHSYAGNPICCAAALASLDLFEREGTLDRANALAAHIAACASRLVTQRGVARVKRCGTMTGIELDAGAPGAGKRIALALYGRGHFTRAIGNTVQLVPPLSTPHATIDDFFEQLEAELCACT